MLCIIRYIHVCCRVYRKMAMSEIDILVIILICIQSYTSINYTVFFRFLSSELTYDNYCTCHSLINCIYQDILLLSIFFSVTSRAIVIFYFRFRSSNNCYYFFLCNVVCWIVIFSFRFFLFIQHTIVIILQSYMVLCFRLWNPWHHTASVKYCEIGL